MTDLFCFCITSAKVPSPVNPPTPAKGRSTRRNARATPAKAVPQGKKGKTAAAKKTVQEPVAVEVSGNIVCLPLALV